MKDFPCCMSLIIWLRLPCRFAPRNDSDRIAMSLLNGDKQSVISYAKRSNPVYKCYSLFFPGLPRCARNDISKNSFIHNFSPAQRFHFSLFHSIQLTIPAWQPLPAEAYITIKLVQCQTFVRVIFGKICGKFFSGNSPKKQKPETAFCTVPGIICILKDLTVLCDSFVGCRFVNGLNCFFGVFLQRHGKCFSVCKDHLQHAPLCILLDACNFIKFGKYRL